jgi:folate receptor
MMLLKSSFLFLFGAVAIHTVSAWEEICSPFHEIYADGTELCEVMWGGAFEVKDDEENAYTMWFFDAETNPNDAVTERILGQDTATDVCGLQYFHKDAPSSEGNGMSECHPWKNDACCHSDTVANVSKIRDSYGEGFEWDRCGPMSPACERFFVQVSCYMGGYRSFVLSSSALH